MMVVPRAAHPKDRAHGPYPQAPGGCTKQSVEPGLGFVRMVWALGVVVALLAGACAGDGTTEVRAGTAPTTVAATSPTTATTTTTSTTPTTASTTTTIPSADIKVEIGVYDGWIRTLHDYCWTVEYEGVDFIWIGMNSKVLLHDTSNDQIVAVAELGPGQVVEDAEGHEHCVFHGMFHDVPLDRPGYVYAVEGDHWGGRVPVEATELEDRRVSTVYFEPGAQAERDEARSS